jgi:hypothetical protein
VVESYDAASESVLERRWESKEARSFIMPRGFVAIGGYEANILWRFLDGVSSAVAMRMKDGSPPSEENLTFLLCELLDANSTSLHALGYPLSQAQADLENSDAGITVDVEFQTHEHSKWVESKYSGADLGIVLAVNHPVLGQSRRGLLVQAKRLFSKGKKHEFGLFSQYTSFDKTQAEFLKVLEQRFGAWNSVFYLWYNPHSTAFPDADAKVLRAYEASDPNPFYLWHRVHPFLDEMLEMGFPALFGNHGPRTASPEEEAALRQWRLTQPALRVSDLDVAQRIGEHGPPQLKALYEARLERRNGVGFSPFADFLLLVLTSSRFGSDNADWIRLTEGQRIAIPTSKSSNERTVLDELETAPIPHHTLKLTVRSTLPSVG